MGCKPFSDEELEEIKQRRGKGYGLTVQRLLATIAADRKWIKELKKEMRERTQLWHNANIEVKQQAFTIAELKAENQRLRDGLKDDILAVEELAAYAHIAWSGWMQYVFHKSQKNPDGTVTIPKWAVDRWDFQARTVYADLPEDMKPTDRKEAGKMLKIIRQALRLQKEE